MHDFVQGKEFSNESVVTQHKIRLDIQILDRKLEELYCGRDVSLVIGGLSMLEDTCKSINKGGKGNYRTNY